MNTASDPEVTASPVGRPVQFGFDENGSACIEGHLPSDNRASARVLEKVFQSFEGGCASQCSVRAVARSLLYATIRAD